jgi:hypothetical protein
MRVAFVAAGQGHDAVGRERAYFARVAHTVAVGVVP